MWAISRVNATERTAVEERGLVATLAKGLDVLAVFADGELLGNQQIAQRAGLSKATASRLCATLTALGYLRLDDRSRKYVVGARLLALGACVQHGSGLLAVAKPNMLALARATGMTVGMAARERTGMVCLDVAVSAGPRVGTTSVGSVLPMAETALGLAYLSHAAPAERIALLRQLQTGYGQAWTEVRTRVEQAMAQYQSQGFVVRPRSCEVNVSAVGAAVLLPGTHGLMAFNCATRSDTIGTTARLQLAGQQLRAMVAHIECQLQPQVTAKPNRSIGGGRKATVTVFSSV